MAQTITVVKGTTACSWGTNSSATPTQTIFTQSSGVAARVIVNSLELYGNSFDQAYVTFYITNGSTGVSSVIGMLRPGSNSSNYAFTMGNQSLTQTGSSAGFVQGVSVIANATGNVYSSVASTPPSGIQFYASQSPSVGGWFPGNFWIANGDSLIVRGYWNNSSATGSVFYNFTVVTES
jgi:hypothetical protein